MDGDLYHYWAETVFLPYTEELRRTGKILLIIDNFSDANGAEDDSGDNDMEWDDDADDECPLHAALCEPAVDLMLEASSMLSPLPTAAATSPANRSGIIHCSPASPFSAWSKGELLSAVLDKRFQAAAECALTATRLSAEESPDNPAHATLQEALQAAAGGQPEPKLPKKVTPSTLQRAGAALEIAAKVEEKKEQQVNKAEEGVANAMCRKTKIAEAVAEAELSVLGAHVKVADAKIAAGQDSSARERQDARDEMSVFDSNDSEEGEEEIEEEEKEDGEQGEDELDPAYIDENDDGLNW
eukprot:jgi/Tetstr1/464299/TSEL_009101.t1